MAEDYFCDREAYIQKRRCAPIELTKNQLAAIKKKSLAAYSTLDDHEKVIKRYLIFKCNIQM